MSIPVPSPKTLSCPLYGRVLIYNRRYRRFHVLDHRSANVLEACDGRAGVPEIARKTLGASKDVWDTLVRLEDFGLIDFEESDN